MNSINKYLCLFMLMVPSFLVAETFDHSEWDKLTKAHVVEIRGGVATEVDYRSFKKNDRALSAYLKQLASVSRAQFDGLSKSEQLAFLINAYNAWTVELILTEYPNLDSIKDLGGFLSSPWKKEFVPLFGGEVSLDHIEHELIRGSGRYNDPRIHFAVNCASVGCPALRAEAYVGDRLDQQLETQTKAFLKDRTRNRLQKKEIEVSSIFKWYQDDFEQGWRGADSLEAFLALYSHSLGLDQATEKRLKSGKIDIEFLDYDWRLNDI